MSLTPEDRQWISEELRLVYHKIEHIETSLLTEFHKWASPNEARQRRYQAELHEFELQLENFDYRLKKLEHPNGK